MECDVLVLGSINLDRIMHVVDFPKPGETVRCQSSAESLGGKGANQAMAAARAGARVSIYAAVGTDDAGRAALDTLGEHIDIGGISRLSDCPTGTAAIQISSAGENVIVIDGGANARLMPSHLPARLPGHRISLAQLEVPIDTIAAFLAAARVSGAITLLNAAPADLAAMPLLPLCDILIVNQTELALFAGSSKEPRSADAAAELARGLFAHDRQTIVVTLGAAGAVAVGAGMRIDIVGRPVDVVDTTGAGDCFCGVLAAALAEGMTLERSLGRANAAAAIQVGRAGAADAMPGRFEIECAEAALFP